MSEQLMGDGVRMADYCDAAVYPDVHEKICMYDWNKTLSAALPLHTSVNPSVCD